MRDYVIGVDVGGTRIRMGMFDSNMQLVAEQRFLTDKDATANELMNFLAQQIRALVEKAGKTASDVRGVGIGFPGSVDFRRGLVLESSNIACLNDQPVREMLQGRLELPVYVDNDANVATLAEHKYGAGRGYDNLIYAVLATGIGGGLILNGQLFRGMHGMAGEIGHMFISDSTGYPCGCGVIGCERVPREKISRYGILKLDGGRIVDLVEKPSPDEAPSDVAIAGRYLLPTAVFGLLATQTPGKGGEIQLTDAIRRYVACAGSKPLLASVYSGKRQDIGNPKGYFEALKAMGANE